MQAVLLSIISRSFFLSIQTIHNGTCREVGPVRGQDDVNRINSGDAPTATARSDNPKQTTAATTARASIHWSNHGKQLLQPRYTSSRYPPVNYGGL